MNVRIAFRLLATFLLTNVSIGEAQEAKVYRVGVLSITDSPVLKGLRDGLKETGYIEGKNLVLNMPVKRTYDELRSLAKLYKEQKVDAIVTVGGTATGIAKETTREIPVVFLYAGDPVGSELVKSLARPEANLTGLTSDPDVEFISKRIEIFKEAVPHLEKVVVLYNARGENPAHVKRLELIQKAAPNLGLKLTEKPVKLPDDVEQALSSLSRDTTDGLFIICASVFESLFKNMAIKAIQKRLALSGCNTQHVIEYGALVATPIDIAWATAGPGT